MIITLIFIFGAIILQHFVFWGEKSYLEYWTEISYILAFFCMIKKKRSGQILNQFFSIYSPRFLIDWFFDN